ncbi:hypothetical protein HMPREF0281_00712 [Corynebacterium ammoniagenes DSM 20306]|uniref:Uncharacterized protein n=1 Tax=Corynebacterium ammoniagenes DSM 20306 TaxID=649754 RepID=A0ABP2IKK7_CORAM|nr:hypothetical protein HMPREF0281_00712 [Corynebacterium ammoniagenes DSM 20306]
MNYQLLFVCRWFIAVIDAMSMHTPAMTRPRRDSLAGFSFRKNLASPLN